MINDVVNDPFDPKYQVWATAKENGFTFEFTGTGSDIFGNKSNTTTSLEMTIYKGKLVTISSVTNTTSTDILGNSSNSQNQVTYQYKEEGGYLVYDEIDTTTSSSGSDIYGGNWSNDGYEITQRYRKDGAIYK